MRNLIRNLMIGAQYIHDHVMHFYHLHALDWVDVVSALKADPEGHIDARRNRSRPTRAPRRAISPTCRAASRSWWESGQLWHFRERLLGQLWALQAAAGSQPHGRGALSRCARVAAPGRATARPSSAARIHTRISSSAERPSAISVHSGEGTGSTAVNTVGLQQVAQIIAQMREFVDQVYVPDTLAIASFYKDWFKTGGREGTGNFLTYGDFPAAGNVKPKSLAGASRRHSRGATCRTSTRTSTSTPEADIQEFVAHSWYDYRGGKQTGLHPYQGETQLNYSGPKPP